MNMEEFNETFSGILNIELNERIASIGKLYNQVAKPKAKIISLEFTPLFIKDCESRQPTGNELDEIVLNTSTLTLIAQSGDAVTHNAPGGQFFTVGDIFNCIEETERKTRGNTDWFGGIDLHHIYFEGLHKEESSNSYRIYWGS